MFSPVSGAEDPGSGGDTPACAELVLWVEASSLGSSSSPGRKVWREVCTQGSCLPLEGPTLLWCRLLLLMSQPGTLLASSHCTQLQLIWLGHPLD